MALRLPRCEGPRQPRQEVDFAMPQTSCTGFLAMASLCLFAAALAPRVTAQQPKPEVEVARQQPAMHHVGARFQRFVKPDVSAGVAAERLPFGPLRRLHQRR